jgi:membrane fusion protein, multidrug efflux system
MNYIKLFSSLLLGGLIIAGCGSKTSTETAQAATVPAQDTKAVIPVKVMQISKTKIARTIDYTATINAFEEVNMAPSTPGRIDKIYVETGDRVNKGDNLFLMDRTQLLQLKLQLSNLEKDKNRLDTLLKSGSAKQQQYDQIKVQYDVTKTNVDFMEQNTLLKAPFSGIVTGKYFEDGEMYSGAPSSPTGKSAVVTVMQINPLKVVVNLSEQYYPLIHKGMKADLTADVYKNEKFTGNVYRISPTITPSSRSFGVEIEVPNNSEKLKPGMYVRVAMNLGEVETFVLPANTILVQEGTNIRFVFINDNGVARRIEVLLGKRYDDQVEILSDNLKEKDQLITQGQSRLVDGDKIEIEK